MKTVSFPSTLDRIEGYCLADKNAVLHIDRGPGNRHGADHGHDDLHDDCRRGGVCVGSFQKGPLKNPY